LTLSRLEAMACGLPVVGTLVPVAWTVVDGVAGRLTRPGDREDLPSSVARLLDDPGKPNLRAARAVVYNDGSCES